MQGTVLQAQAVDPVAAQYEQWSYPQPAEDLNSPALAEYLNSYKSLRGLWWAYWPRGLERDDLDILVAGCGSMAAACYAYLYPNCRVLGVDISTASLAHEQRLKERHNLSNLTLRECRLEEARSLEGEFDYISCHGVLHHMADPVAGLRAIGSLLRPDGVIAILLYGKHGRAPVYPFQELFRLIGLGQTPEAVAIVREVLAALPQTHYLQRYLRQATDLNTDSGIVDTFLHRRDRPYSVADCLELTRSAGLAFGGWDEPTFYYPEGRINGTPMFRACLDRLGEEDQWKAMELALGNPPGHFFHVCRGDRDPATYLPPFDREELLDCAPIPRGQLQRNTEASGPPFVLRRQPHAPLGLDQMHAAVYSHFDGQRSLRECFQAAGVSSDSGAMMQIARPFMKFLLRVGDVHLRMPVHA